MDDQTGPGLPGDVPDGPRPPAGAGWPPPAGAGWPPPTGAGWPPAALPPVGVDGLSSYVPAGPPAPRRRVPLRGLAVVFAAFAVLVGSTSAFLAVRRGDGAESPEAAVRQLFAALDDEDAIGLMAVLPAEERELLKQPVVDIVAELQRLGVLRSFSLEQVPGADLQVAGLTLVSTPVGERDDLVSVEVTGGTISGRVLPDSVPLGATLEKIITQDFDTKIDIKPEHGTEDLAKSHVKLVTVQDTGGWHVSLFYTIAESIRNGQRSVPVPVLGGGPAPFGADTPDGAVRAMVDAAVNLDPGRVIALLPPDEMRVVYDYAPLFLPDADREAAKVKGEYFAKVHRFETRVEGDGDTRRVITTAFDVEIRTKDDGTFRVGADGECITIAVTGRDRREDETEKVCANQPATTTTTSRRPGTFRSSGLGDLGMFNGLSTDYAVTVVERDGRWYVSPIRTVLDATVAALRKLTPEQLEAWAKQLAEFGRPTTSKFRPVECNIGGGDYTSVPGSTPYPVGTTPYYEYSCPAQATPGTSRPKSGSYVPATPVDPYPPGSTVRPVPPSRPGSTSVSPAPMTTPTTEPGDDWLEIEPDDDWPNGW